MDLFLIHGVVLIWLSLGAARRLASTAGEQFLAAGLLGWGNLVVTGLLLSLFGRLGSWPWLLGLSCLLATTVCLTSRFLLPPLPPVAATGPAPHPALLTVFFITLLGLIAASAAIASFYPPSSPDAMAWQLPRALFYLGQNDLTPFVATDLRQLYFPFNHTLLQLPALAYDAPLPCLAFFNLGAWALAGLGVYRLCLRIGFGTNAALIACWLALTAIPVLAQAITVSPELPAGAALVALLIFTHAWWTTRQDRHAALAGLAAGLAFGSSLNFLLLGLTAGLAGLLVSFRPPRFISSRPFSLRPWIFPGLLATVTGLAFALVNFVHELAWPSKLTAFLLSSPTGTAPVVYSTLWFPLPAQPAPLVTLDESSTGPGLITLFFVLAGCLALPPGSRSRVYACCGLGWGLVRLALCPWLGGGVGDFIPALFLLCVPVADWIDRPATGTGSIRRSLACWLLLPVAGAALWSAGVYLLKNTRRPLLPVVNRALPAPAPSKAPLVTEFRLRDQTAVNINSDGINEPLLTFMTLGQRQRFTALPPPDSSAYNLLSRSSSSRNAPYPTPRRRASYVLLGFPAKRTSGVEFLGTHGTEAASRDYYGLVKMPGHSTPHDGDRSVLVTVYYDPPTHAGRQPIHLTVVGLNPEDQARVLVQAEFAGLPAETLATFASDGTARASVALPFHRLLFTLSGVDSPSLIAASADIPYQVLPGLASDDLPIPPANPAALFSTDLIQVKTPNPLGLEGLLPAEGPFPQWNLPLLRWARSPSVRIIIPPLTNLARLELAFSTRLHVRKKAALDVLFNGQLVQRYRIDDSTIWVDHTLTLKPQTGENVIEFRDAPLNNEPDWLDYLHRYPDVEKYVVTHHIPLEQGARDHYEGAGRAEGRTLNLIERPEPAPDGYYFMFRKIQLEGFKSP